MRDLTQSERDAIETTIDSSSVFDVLAAISKICYEKAEHVRENWQDESLAKLWERCAARIWTVGDDITL